MGEHVNGTAIWRWAVTGLVTLLIVFIGISWNAREQAAQARLQLLQHDQEIQDTRIAVLEKRLEDFRAQLRDLEDRLPKVP